MRISDCSSDVCSSDLSNRIWALARRGLWHAPGIDLGELDPPVSMDGSDSQSLDDMLEVLLAGGMDALQAMRILVPPAEHALEQLNPDLAAFYEYYALHKIGRASCRERVCQYG